MLLWEAIGVFYFRSGCLSAWLKNLLVSRIWHFLCFSFSHQQPTMHFCLLQTSGHIISIMDTTIIMMSTIFSIAFHEFGHAIAAARSLCLPSHFFFSLLDVLHFFFFVFTWNSKCLLMNNFHVMFWHILFYMCNSDGVEIEYVAIFVAVLFPGAFVALNYDLLLNLPPFPMLRIYCAGIWHNVAVSHCYYALIISKTYD